jgi:tetratricopeptide (TPR) repeat protein
MLVKSSAVATLALICTACAPSDGKVGAGDAGGAARAVSLPDLSGLDAHVQAQVRDRYTDLRAVLERPRVPSPELAEAYGRLGMVLDAAEYHDAAEPAYLNARDIAPDDPRWPYYLAHLYRGRGDIAHALAAFTRVVDLRPLEAAPLTWLGRLYLEQGQADLADSLFERALTIAPRSVAALAGLGQAALARRDFARAAARLEEALALDPTAASIHSPLAAAYRALGDTKRAEAHLAQWRNTEILIADPWRQELDLTLETGLAYELRGVRALDGRDFTAAAEFFQKGAALEPATTALGRSLRHKLGTARYLGGDVRGAIEQFEEVVRLSPATPPDETAARAHYSLGVVMASGDRDDEAIRHLRASVKYSPHYVEALQALGDILRRSGRTSESLGPYAEILAVSPAAAAPRFGYAMALVRLGRYREALDWLSEGARRHPDRPEFTHAMARLLAAAPDAGVRDGRRAMALVDQLLAGDKTIELGETTAMALAEVGDYDEAAAVLRQVMAAATRDGLAFDRGRMVSMLELYERGRPSRSPWPDDHAVHRPGVAQTLALDAVGPRT